MHRAGFKTLVSSLVLTTMFIVGGRPMALAGPAANAANNRGREAVVSVTGLSCPLCARRLQKVLSALPGATEAKIELAKGWATIDFAPHSKTSNEQIANTIRDAGFVPGAIVWSKPGDHHGNQAH